MCNRRGANTAKRSHFVFRKNKNINTKKIGVIGLSAGGLVSACAVGIVKGIKSLVLLSAVARYKKLWDKKLITGGRKGFPKAGVDVGGLLVGRDFYEALERLDDFNLKSIRNFKNPLLIIHGENDKVVLSFDAKLYYNTSGSLKKKLIIVKNADHTFANVKSEKRVIGIICKWFKRTLK